MKAFIDLPWRLYAKDANWVPPLKAEVKELLTPGKNPFFGHARAQYFLARRNGQVVGRVSAHIDELALRQPPEQGMGPGTGNFGLFEAEDAQVGEALIAAAEQWLRAQGMTRVLGPISLSIWEEPGLLVEGHDHPPTVMMGHNSPAYQAMIEGAGYVPVKQLKTYELDITQDFPPLIQRIVQSGEKNGRIHIRKVDKAKFDQEAAIILAILNDAWGQNWGFVPITDAEVAHTGKKLKPIIHPQINLIAEVDGKPVAFMLTLPDINDVLRKVNGRLWPLGWLRLLRWMRKPSGAGMRVPLMGVRRELHNSRLASQLAFMMISQIREVAIAEYQTKRAEIGWILDDNQGMKAIADAIGSTVNREYAIYERSLAS